jgi:hypothetical protein
METVLLFRSPFSDLSSWHMKQSLFSCAREYAHDPANAMMTSKTLRKGIVCFCGSTGGSVSFIASLISGIPQGPGTPCDVPGRLGGMSQAPCQSNYDRFTGNVSSGPAKFAQTRSEWRNGEGSSAGLSHSLEI